MEIVMFSFSKKQSHLGSTRCFWNVDKNGVPFCQIWTWPNTKTETHPYHVAGKTKEHKTFLSIKDAKDYVRGL